LRNNAPVATSFGDLYGPPHRDDAARAAVLPVPLERTVSWGRGTAAGPAAILEASRYLELWDEELGMDPSTVGIATLPPVGLPDSLSDALATLRWETRAQVEDGKLLLILGGEHSLTAGTVRGTMDATNGPLGVVQFDAHADLREEYEGSALNHACVMRRILDDELPTLAVGIRSLSQPEAELVRDRQLPVVWSHELATLGEERWRALLGDLPETVYLTFDLDFFDPSLLPATGTPEPGGGLWHPTMALLKILFATKRVVAADFVELAPIAGLPASDFVAAKLVYKCLGYWLAGQ
jgi:N1-aminopropylagmatine ureohydrolase